GARRWPAGPCACIRAAHACRTPTHAERGAGSVGGVEGTREGLAQAWLPLRRSDHDVRTHAGDRHRRRPPRRLLASIELTATFSALCDADNAENVAVNAGQWPVKVGAGLARNAATALQWSSVAPHRAWTSA